MEVELCSFFCVLCWWPCLLLREEKGHVPGLEECFYVFWKSRSRITADKHGTIRTWSILLTLPVSGVNIVADERTVHRHPADSLKASPKCFPQCCCHLDFHPQNEGDNETVNASSALISAWFKVSWLKRAKGGAMGRRRGEGERVEEERQLRRGEIARGGVCVRKRPWGTPHCGWPRS